MRGLSVIVPTFEEAGNIPILIPRIEAAIGDIGPHEIIVVDDSSSDGTAEIAEGLSGRFPVRTLRREGKRTLSGSVLEGARNATYDCIAVLDADLSHQPQALQQVSAPVLAGKADLVIGSRHIEGGMIEGWPIRRRLLSGLGTILARLIAHVKDPLSGYFVCRRELLVSHAIGLRPCGYKILLEILGRIQDLRVEEIPIRFSDRASGKSKLGFRQQREFVAQMVSLFVHRAKGILKTGWLDLGFGSKRAALRGVGKETRS